MSVSRQRQCGDGLLQREAIPLATDVWLILAQSPPRVRRAPSTTACSVSHRWRAQAEGPKSVFARQAEAFRRGDVAKLPLTAPNGWARANMGYQRSHRLLHSKCATLWR
jgi:hypothetical protein